MAGEERKNIGFFTNGSNASSKGSALTTYDAVATVKEIQDEVAAPMSLMIKHRANPIAEELIKEVNSGIGAIARLVNMHLTKSYQEASRQIKDEHIETTTPKLN